ncbi:DUF6786 family protein [Cohnella rhizosphaerae]|uniref:DUF4380 domain-containing protein n=1 Tax=Cohnella rhizosphaerae TaxID=1457232 RepID=A0A9X4KWE2_9BACL|nr:DUF6786 family protein [Cohnella rhizosphaerae]MDG0812105.1 hypothetical protein [Cohnella rhizosphaerae]
MTETREAHLKQLGEPYVKLTGEEGGTLLVLVRGGRVHDMSVTGGQAGASFWTNPAALEAGGWNTGGDRTWVSPEIEYFTDSAGSYAIPPQLDPGRWTLVSSTGSEALVRMTCELPYRASAARIRLDLEKRFAALPNPLRLNASLAARDWTSVRYVGYDVQTELELTPVAQEGSDARANSGYCSLWSIMQVPAGGVALVPTRGPVAPMTMFAQREPDDIATTAGGVRIPCGGSYSFKLSFDAVASTGRYGYLRRLGASESSLVVRQFRVNPAGLYPDYPPDRPDYLGSCMQVYNDGGHLGGFAELEYQSPALPIDRPGRTNDASQVFHFTGPTKKIREIAELLLGMDDVSPDLS